MYLLYVLKIRPPGGERYLSSQFGTPGSRWLTTNPAEARKFTLPADAAIFAESFGFILGAECEIVRLEDATDLESRSASHPSPSTTPGTSLPARRAPRGPEDPEDQMVLAGLPDLMVPLVQDFPPPQ
jgi:hypothetical protein